MKTLLRKIRLLIGLDRAVGLTLIANGWTAVSGIVTLLLLTRMLSPDEQGFYYTFNGFLGATILLELGLSYVVLQFASHESASLEWTPDGLLTGNAAAKARLSSLLRLSLRWYGVIAALIVALVLPAGLLFFARYAPSGAHIAWQVPWVGVTLAVAGTMVLSPVLAVLQGCGLVAEVAQVQVMQNVSSSLLLWLALSLHWGLGAAPVTGLTLFGIGAGWLWRRKRRFLRDLLRRPSRSEEAEQAGIDWRGEVWPFQWKIALSGISFYIIFQLFTPILFAAHGASAAGRMGLSLTAMQAISALAMAWLTTKMPAFGSLAAQRAWDRMDRLFFPTLWQSWIAAIAGAGLFWAGAFWLHQERYALGERLLAPLPLGLLAGAAIVNHLVSAEALYLRAHKQEPFLWLSLTVAALIGLSDLLLGKPYGADGLMLGYFLITLLVGLGGGTWLFVQKRRLWHSAPVLTGTVAAHD